MRRRYNYTQPLSYITSANQKLAKKGTEIIPPEDSFAKTAYEWKNSLRVAAEKMLGDHPIVQRKFTFI